LKKDEAEIKTFKIFLKEEHPLTNAIFVHSSLISRPVRTALNYLSVVITLAITVFFGDVTKIAI
jgi:hypothetical protein